MKLALLNARKCWLLLHYAGENLPEGHQSDKNVKPVHSQQFELFLMFRILHFCDCSIRNNFKILIKK